MVVLRILLLLVLSSFALFDKMFRTQKVESLIELEVAVRDVDFLTLVVYYDENGEKSQMMEELFQETRLLYLEYFQIVAYPCQDNPKICTPEMVPNLPLIMGYIPQGYTEQGKPQVKTKRLEALKVDQEVMNEFVTDNMPFLGEVILTEDADDFFNQENFNSIILFTDEEDVSPEICALSSMFRWQANFGLIRKEEKALVDRFNIQKFPSLVVVEGDRHFIQPDYQSERLGSMIEFVKRYTTEEKIKPYYFDYQEDLYPQQILTAEFFEQQLVSHEQVALVHFYTDTKLAEWSMIHKHFKGSVLTAGMDCNDPDNAAYAAQLGVKKYPVIRLFPSNRNKKSFTVVYENLVELQDVIEKNMYSNVQEVGEKKILEFVAMTRVNNVMGILLFIEGKCPLAVQALSDDPRFKEKIYFGQSKEKEDIELLKGFHVTKYPTLVAFDVIDAKLKILPTAMDGDMFSYTAVQSFLSTQLNAYYKRAPEIKHDDMEAEDVDIFTSQSFANQCTNGKLTCVIFIYDHEKFGKISKDHIQMMKKLKLEYRRKSAPLVFGWMDGGCYPDFIDKFGVSQLDLPTMILYSGKNHPIEELSGELSYESAREKLISQLVNDKEYLEVEAEGISLYNRNCKAFRKEIASAETDTARQEVIANFQKKEEDKYSGDDGSGKKDKKKKKRKSMSRSDL